MIGRHNSFNASQEVQTLELAAKVARLAGIEDERLWADYDDQDMPGARAARLALGTAQNMLSILSKAGVLIGPEHINVALQQVNERIAHESESEINRSSYNSFQQEGDN